VLGVGVKNIAVYTRCSTIDFSTIFNTIFIKSVNIQNIRGNRACWRQLLTEI